MEVKISQLVPCEWNPRTVFAGEKHEQLVESVRQHGVIEPLVVRQKGKTKYEIIAGERRYRAAKACKHHTVPVVVKELSDREAKELTVTENVQRQDLNPIDEARGFAMLLESDNGTPAPTQTELAKRLGVSQGHIANRLRLLKLPAEWHRRIISGEIPASYAREIIPFIGYPKILKAIEKSVDRDVKRDGPGALGTIRDFSHSVRWAVRNNSGDLNSGDWLLGYGEVPKLKPNAQQLKELDVIEVTTPTGKKEKYAANMKLFKKLHAEHVKKWKASKDKAGGNGKAKSKPAKKLTPAEERARAKERAAQFRRRLWEFKVDWIRAEIAITLREYENDRDDIMVILLWMAGERPATGMISTREIIERQLRMAGLKASHDFAKSVMQYPGEVMGEDCGLLSFACGCLAGWFVNEKGEPLTYVVHEPAVLAIADRLGIELAEQWAEHRAGNLTERYFTLHDKEQLLELADSVKLKLEPADKKTKASLVAALMAAEDMTFPKELKTAKRPR